MFFITNCVNTEIRGPVRAYHNPADLPFTQGTIKEINNAKASGYNWVIQVRSIPQSAWGCNVLEALGVMCMLPVSVTHTMLCAKSITIVGSNKMQLTMWWIQTPCCRDLRRLLYVMADPCFLADMLAQLGALREMSCMHSLMPGTSQS